MFLFKKRPKTLTVEAAVQVLQSRGKRARWTDNGTAYRGEFEYTSVTRQGKFRLILAFVEHMPAGEQRFSMFESGGVVIQIPVDEITIELANNQLMFINWVDHFYFTIDLKE